MGVQESTANEAGHTVTRALEEYVARIEQRRATELFGELDWDPTFDYKAERSRDR